MKSLQAIKFVGLFSLSLPQNRRVNDIMINIDNKNNDNDNNKFSQPFKHFYHSNSFNLSTCPVEEQCVHFVKPIGFLVIQFKVGVNPESLKVESTITYKF